jgi:type I restriction enzyme, S subunit
MQGKLVPQDPNDQPASELLQEIEAEKKRLVKDRTIKQSKPLSEIKPEEVPYKLPTSWEWIRLNNALDVRDGTHDTPKYVDIGYPLITSKNRQFKSEVQQVLMAEDKILRKAFDSQGIF